MPTKRGQRTAGGKRAKRKPRSRAETPTAPAPSPSQADANEVDGFLLDEGLTTAQLLFVETLCADPTKPAVVAARVAYPDQTANAQYVTAHENLRNPKIKAAIVRRLSPLLHTTRTSREQVTKLIGEGMHWDPADVYAPDGSIRPVREWPIEARRQLSSIEVDELTLGQKVIGVTKKVRFHNRETFIALGARMNKMLTDRVEVVGAQGRADRLRRALERTT